ncbi:TraB/GumN family protein [Aureimonas sp. AU12]|uniref:TraB/GumN family protein n=1 Tax=Aureimonas sp. AU12 TaxID=1638161 RepID=UPI000706CD82|nr:TraB/GumN family protein [Aureimonas sp. AU12]BAT29659.1 hypothetical protein [Aureimonas sp. AU12]
MTVRPLPIRLLAAHALKALWAAAALLPLLLCAALLAALARAPAAHASEPASCREGTSAVPALMRDGRIAAIEREAAEIANGEGRLYRAERDGLAPSFLFGTMHLSDPRILALPPAAETAFTGARSLVIETLDVLDPRAMAGALLARPDLTTLPPGQTIETLLPPAEMARIGPLLAARALPVGAIRTLQPWFVTMSLMVPACEAARTADGAKVLDIALAERAAAAGQTVRGLETAVEQTEALGAMPLALQADNLVATAAIVDQLPDVFETMIDLYLKGRIALIEPATEAMMPAGTEMASSVEITQRFEETVVRARNGVMATRLAPLLAQGGVFVAVGALHLPGETGLVEALRGAGWRVTRAD